MRVVEPRVACALVGAVLGVFGGGASGVGQSRGCDAPEVSAAMAAAAGLVQRVEDAAAVTALQGIPACRAAVVARVALEAWIEARRLASVGGAPAELGAVARLLGQLEALAAEGPPSALDVQGGRYAHAVIRAAVAAAQDERDEMQVYLAHARTLAASLAAAGVRVWPLTLDEAEGELWLEVDRFAEARGAFERAVEGGGARSLVGLGRALQRLGDRPAACAAYRRAAVLPLGEPAAGEVQSAVRQLACSPPPER